MSDSEKLEKLSAMLRATSSRAAEIVGSGCALLFAAMPGEDAAHATTTLRAAAGFDSPDAARAAAEALLPTVRELLISGAPASAPAHPGLGARGQAGFAAYPLAWEGDPMGCLLVGFPTPITETTAQNLAHLASTASLHLDHAHVSAEVTRLHAALSETEGVADEKTDELLKLSEALFAQDIELLRNNEKLGKIEKLKNDFIEKMSRELRTPLNSIIEAIIGVLAGENETISDTSKSSMRYALDEGTAFQRTLENILDLWRVKQGELPVELQEVNFAEVAEEAI
ncbi:MAG: HAMP domain-containing histidine kinase, partial [Deltaproteobacteria bacterium]|nr:HAMP domain-containing histidine kinase [Deltaproteobacteria bacterium]